MPMFDDSVLDASLNAVRTGTTVMHICSAEPANYAGVAAVSLGTKTSPSIATPVDHTGTGGGRKVIVAAVTDGTVDLGGPGNDDATHYAFVSADTLLAAGELASTQNVTHGNTWTTAAFDVIIRDPIHV